MRYLILILSLSLSAPACSPAKPAIETLVPQDAGPEVSALPQPLRAFLERQREFHLETQSDAKLKEHFSTGRIRPFVVSDANRDGRDDVVAVLIKDKLYNVAVFHTTTTGFSIDPTWVLRDEQHAVSGVLVDADGTVVPLFCYNCDANPRYRWTGTNYRQGVFLPNETACVKGGAFVYSDADLQSPLLVQITKAGGEAVVLATALTQEQVWYEVRLVHPAGHTGFIQETQLAKPDGFCVDPDAGRN